MRHLVDRTGIDPTLIDDVIAGCVLQHDQQSSNIGRHAVLSAGLPESVPAVTVDRQCGSGQQAVNFAAQGIMAGTYDLAIACGVESMSQVSMPPAFRPGSPPLGPQYGPLELARYDGGLMAQGPSSELMNERFGLTREALDEFSIRSHERALAATREGRFADQLVPITSDPHDPSGPTIDSDEGIRASLDPDKIASLKTVFATDGRTTAANSSQISDGAAALLLADRTFAETHGLTPPRPIPLLERCSGRPDHPIHRRTRRDPQGTEALRSHCRRHRQVRGERSICRRTADIPARVRCARRQTQRQRRISRHRASARLHRRRMLTDLLHELECSTTRLGLQTICEAHGTANTTIIERI